MSAAKYTPGDRHVVEHYLATMPDYIYRIIIREAMKESNIHNIIRLVVEIDFSLKRNRELRQMKSIPSLIDSNALTSTMVKSNTNVSQGLLPFQLSQTIAVILANALDTLSRIAFKRRDNKRIHQTFKELSDKLIRYYQLLAQIILHQSMQRVYYFFKQIEISTTRDFQSKINSKRPKVFSNPNIS